VEDFPFNRRFLNLTFGLIDSLLIIMIEFESIHIRKDCARLTSSTTHDERLISFGLGKHMDKEMQHDKSSN
jgi:hypothetical protein